MTTPVCVYNPLAYEEVLAEFPGTTRAQCSERIHAPFEQATRDQLQNFLASVEELQLPALLSTHLGWPATYAAETLHRALEFSAWHLENAVVSGVPLGIGFLAPDVNEPLDVLPHLVTALLAGNSVIVTPTAQVAGVATAIVNAARAAQLPVDIAYLAPELFTDLSANPHVAFVTWWDESYRGFDRLERWNTLAPGQLWPRRLWGRFDGNAVAIVHADADVQAAARNIAQFAFGQVALTTYGIERVVVAAEIHDDLIAELENEARNAATIVYPTSQHLERATSFAALASMEGTIQVPQDALGSPLISVNVPQSATTVCEPAHSSLLSVQRAKTADDMLKLSASGMYGSLAVVYGGTGADIEAVRRGNIAGTVFRNELRFPHPTEVIAMAKLSGYERFPMGPELIRNYVQETPVLTRE